ncbi:MAG: FAD-dependent monooxygenase [Candidatus Thermoplasmatota archaeon]|nr:FAD-dependent monooxygenase [Candidatus Thermoplasmatota archaeon]
MSETDYDVIVVGGGPIGSIASLSLSERGLRVCLVEKNINPYPFPRGIALNGFTMGVIKKLLGDTWDDFDFTTAIEVGYVLGKDRMNEPFGKMQPPVIDGAVLDLDHYGFINWFNQPQLESLLRARIEDDSGIDALYGHEALILWEDGMNFITVQDNTTGETRTLASRFLIGADGGGSFVRKQMGANLESLGKSIHFLIVDINAPRTALQPGMDFDAGGHQIIDPEGKRPTTFLLCEGKNHGTYKNTFRFEFALNKDDDHAVIQSPDSIRKLVSPYLNPDEVKIVRSTVYKFNSLISKKWRRGNMFTIGDATHQTSPFIGQGLNLGVRNTLNLVNKIDLVSKGVSAPELLDQYQVECYPDSKFIIKQSLFLGGLLFNVKPHVNLLRRVVHTFKGGRGRPLDLLPAFVPETITIPNGFGPRKSSQKGYPMYNYKTEEGLPRSLRTYHPTEYRILCKDSSNQLDGHTERIPDTIRPLVVSLSDGKNGEKTSQTMLVSCQREEDLKMHRKLFKGVDYVLMAPGYTMLGTYRKGEESRMVSDYLSMFRLL